MKRLFVLFGILVLVAGSLVTIAEAQMGGAMGRSMSMTGLTGIMDSLNHNGQMMSSRMKQLEDHWSKMMGMDNMRELKAEMQKHHEMMSSMSSIVGEQMSICQSMMTMMHSNGMHNHMSGMMGGQAESSAHSVIHGHSH